MSEERLTRIEEGLTEFRTGQQTLTTEVADLRSGQDKLSTQVVELRTHMGVLHEETLDRIAALAPDLGPIEGRYQEADAQLREDINRRLEPLEAWARDRRG